MKADIGADQCELSAKATVFDRGSCRTLPAGDKLPIKKFTTHDLRRTVATQLTERGVMLDLVATVIGHEAGGRETRTLVRHYVGTDLLDRKRSSLEAWQRRLSEIIEGNSLRECHSVCGHKGSLSERLFAGGEAPPRTATAK